jgi:SAM-dependent methyltransferase
MRTYLSLGDFIDLAYKIQIKGWDFFLRKFRFSAIARAEATWNIETLPPTNWWVIPAIQKRWNEKISGDAKVTYAEYVANSYPAPPYSLSLLVPACGTGSHEQRLTAFKHYKEVLGFDISKACIEEAQAKVLENPQIETTFRYCIADAHTLKLAENYYDVVLFHSSIHHIDKLDIFVQKIHKSLKKNGLLILHDFVGANRLNWKKEQLVAANAALQLIPKHLRKKWKTQTIKNHIYCPGWWRMYLSDPSEAVESENILPAIRKHFEILEEKKLGGDIIHLVLKDIAHHFITENPENKIILQQLFDFEDTYLAQKSQSDFMFGVYKKA